MTCHFTALAREASLPAALVEAMRSRREAREAGQLVIPRIFSALASRGIGMMAPALESVISLTEAALGRPLHTGTADDLSSDEMLVLGLLDGTIEPAMLHRSHGLANALVSAIRSAQIMAAKTPPVPNRPLPGAA